MIEIYPSLYIGNEADYEINAHNLEGWVFVHACKEPYHRQALGYTGRAAPKNHPEYLIARRDKHLILNLVDAPDPAYIPNEIIDAALEFIHQGLSTGQQVLVHCNQGESRSPDIGILYLAKFTDKLLGSGFNDAEKAFREIYPPYNPGIGVRGFLQMNWHLYSTSAD